tara:strand:- start:16227 stop:16670 length:444 start_codon:yes stop_codon:yes gene_type:complete
MPKQRELDFTYLEMATSWSQLSKAKRKKVGCLVVKDGQIISDGYNGTPKGYDNDCEFETRFGFETRPEVLHAESNALMKLAKSTNSSENCTIYLTLSPCFECSKLLVQAGVKRVVYNEQYRDTSGLEFLKVNGIEVEQLKMYKINES